MTDFIPGQRWVSNVEPKLGLGLILEVAYKWVTVSFLGNVTRIYAQDSSQLTRFQFSKDNLIESIDGDQITVISVSDQDGLITYFGKNKDGIDLQLHEKELIHDIKTPTDQSLNDINNTIYYSYNSDNNQEEKIVEIDNKHHIPIIKYKKRHITGTEMAGSRYFCDRFFRASCSKNQQKSRDR